MRPTFKNVGNLAENFLGWGPQSPLGQKGRGCRNFKMVSARGPPLVQNERIYRALAQRTSVGTVAVGKSESFENVACETNSGAAPVPSNLADGGKHFTLLSSPTDPLTTLKESPL